MTAKDDIACVLYQHDIRNAVKIGKITAKEVEIKQNRAASQNILDIEVLDDADSFSPELNYSSSCYGQSLIERFGNLFVGIAECLVHGDCGADITVGEIFDKFVTCAREK